MNSLKRVTVGGERQWEGSDFATVLRSAIEARGLSLDRLRHHLGLAGHEVSVATLSYWQSGRSRPERAASRAALASLEEILQVSPGTLTTLLVSRRRAREGAEPQATFPAAGDLVLAQKLEQMVAQIGLSWHHHLQRLIVHDQLTLDADRTLTRHVVREVVRAARDGVDRYPIWHLMDDCDAIADLVPVTHCRLGQVVEDADLALVVGELILDHPLERGESLVVEHILKSRGQTTPLMYWRRSCADHMREMHMEVHFHPDAIPVSADRSFAARGQAERTEPIVIRSTSIESLMLDFGPGYAGLSWTW